MFFGATLGNIRRQIYPCLNWVAENTQETKCQVAESCEALPIHWTSSGSSDHLVDDPDNRTGCRRFLFILRIGNDIEIPDMKLITM